MGEDERGGSIRPGGWLLSSGLLALLIGWSVGAGALLVVGVLLVTLAVASYIGGR